MRMLRKLLLVPLAIVGALLYWKLGFYFGLPVLLFVVSLAIVGSGNRLLWSAIFPLTCCVIAAAIYGVYQLMPQKAEFAKLLLAFVLVSVVPGAILWAAAKLRQVRLNRRASIID